ncbi:MAG TPA: FHA domain-containing protein [Gemmataceae bacterium]|nr:FHA domain-containing protein [Gemmataceae bacterium]
MLGELLPCGGGRPIPLVKPKLLVGRQRECDIPLPFATVSSRHCELEYREGFWHVRDLGSKNGTYVNGAACTATSLLPDDVLAVATICFKVTYPEGKGPRRESQSNTGNAPGSHGQVKRGDDASLVSRPPSVPSGPSSPVPYGHLVPCGGGSPIPLRKERVVIGRNSDCDVVLRHSTVSGRHCQLEWQDEQSCWLVRDLDSRNGIRVDGSRCESKLLRHGSILWIASHRYQVVYGSLRAETARGPVFAQSLLQAAGLE